MKKFIILLLISTFIGAAGCGPRLPLPPRERDEQRGESAPSVSADVRKESAEPEPAQSATPAPNAFPTPSALPSVAPYSGHHNEDRHHHGAQPSTLPDDIPVPTLYYDLGDITFECPYELEYYDDGDSSGYTYSIYHEIMLDITQFTLDEEIDPVGDEEGMKNICRDVAEHFAETGTQNANVSGDLGVNTLDVNGTTAYYTIFDAETDGIDTVAACVAFDTQNCVYKFSVIAASEQYEDMYFDIIDSIEIINPADYSPSQKISNPRSELDAAAAEAADYIGFGVSRKNLIQILIDEGYSRKTAAQAVDGLDIDWEEEAAICAGDYIIYTDMTDFNELAEQLEYEGFTPQQARYGARAALNDFESGN